MTLDMVPGFACVTLDRPMGFGHRSAACATWKSYGTWVGVDIVAQDEEKLDNEEFVVCVGRKDGF